MITLLNVAFMLMAAGVWVTGCQRERYYRDVLNAAARDISDIKILLADSRAIVAEGNEICNMAPKFRVLLARAEKGIEYVT
jgi:hypothetical protein